MRSSHDAKPNANGYGFANTCSNSYTYRNSNSYSYTNSDSYSYSYTNGIAVSDTYTNLHANPVAANFRPRRGLDHRALCEGHHALCWQLRTFFYQQCGSKCGDALPEHRSRAALDAR